MQYTLNILYSLVAVKCPLAVPNGEITGECNLTVGSTCNFKCNDGSTSTSSFITCNYQGKWLTDNLCLGKQFLMS